VQFRGRAADFKGLGALFRNIAPSTPSGSRAGATEAIHLLEAFRASEIVRVPFPSLWDSRWDHFQPLTQHRQQENNRILPAAFAQGEWSGRDAAAQALRDGAVLRRSLRARCWDAGGQFVTLDLWIRKITNIVDHPGRIAIRLTQSSL
jgi:hypothetical protein